MTLKSCRTCRAPVARTAEACPACGAHRPAGYTPGQILLAVALIAILGIGTAFIASGGHLL